MIAALAGRRRLPHVARLVATKGLVPAKAFTAHARGLASWGKGIPVTMPALSPTMAAGKIAKWSKKEGG